MERAANIIARLDSYWNSVQSWVDEYRELDADRLRKLLDINSQCLEKLDNDPEHYWEWRNSQPWTDGVVIGPERQRPLEKVRSVCMLAKQAAMQVLFERGLLCAKCSAAPSKNGILCDACYDATYGHEKGEEKR